MAAIRLVLICLFALPLAACASTDIAEKKEPEPKQTKQIPRRAVPAMVDRPNTTTPPPPTVPMPSVPQAAVPAGPSAVTGCDPGGCWSGGARYNGGAGGTYIDKGGRPCQSNGTFMQCF